MNHFSNHPNPEHYYEHHPQIQYVHQPHYYHYETNPMLLKKEQTKEEHNSKLTECILYYYKFDSKISKMVSVLQNKIYFRTMKFSFDRLAHDNSISQQKICTQKHLVTLLTLHLTSLSKTITNNMKQNKVIGFYKIMTSATSNRPSKSKRENLSTTKYQLTTLNKFLSETDIGSDKSSRQHQNFINNMGKLLDQYSEILQTPSNKNIYKRSISPIYTLSPTSPKNQGFKSKEKYEIKRKD